VRVLNENNKSCENIKQAQQEEDQKKQQRLQKKQRRIDKRKQKLEQERLEKEREHITLKVQSAPTKDDDQAISIKIKTADQSMINLEPASTCAICQCSYHQGETIAVFVCKHVFHEECRNAFNRAPRGANKRYCPICKQSRRRAKEQTFKIQKN